jgi:hypothetical protein
MARVLLSTCITLDEYSIHGKAPIRSVSQAKSHQEVIWTTLEAQGLSTGIQLRV